MSQLRCNKTENLQQPLQVLTENKLDVAQKKFEKFCYSLYSVESASKSDAKRLHVANTSDCKW